MVKKTFELSDDPDIKEISKVVSKVFQEDWKTSYNYNNVEAIKFKSKPVERKYVDHSGFALATVYTSEIARKMDDFNTSGLDPFIIEELNRWNDKGGFCIYISVLLYCLLDDLRVYKSEDLNLIQGYYDHETQGILAMFDNKYINQRGLHTWVEADGCVLDIAIVQERAVFNFEGPALIMGEIPEKFDLVGWREGKEIVKKYAREMAAESGLKYYQWLHKHKMAALDICIPILRKGLDEF